MTRQIDCINLFSKMMRNMFELLYKDRSEIYNTSNKEEIRKIIDNTVNDTEIINIQNEFKKYTPTEGKKLLSDLEIFKQKANAIKSEENLNLMHLNILKFLDHQRNSSMAADKKWENLKAKMRDTKLNTEKIESIENSKVISENLTENNENIKEVFSESNSFKPLGEAGEITVNEALRKGIEVFSPLLDIYKNHPIEVKTGFSVITTLMMYKSVVNLYNKIAFKEYPDITRYNVEIQRMRNKEIKFFMLVGAPLIVGALCGIKNVFPTKIIIQNETASSSESLQPNLIEKISQSSNNLDLASTPAEANKELDLADSKISKIPFLGGIYRRIPGWLRSVITTIALYYGIKYLSQDILGIGNPYEVIDSVFKNYTNYVKLFFKIGAISCLFIIIYYIVTIFMFIMLSKEKIFATQVPIYLPQFILDWIKFLKRISSYPDKGIFIEFYLRLIFIYIFILIITLYVLYSI